MRRTFLCIFVLTAVPSLWCQSQSSSSARVQSNQNSATQAQPLLTQPAFARGGQQGTLVRMRMTECSYLAHGFMAAMSGPGVTDSGVRCPEYVLVTEKVVYVIGGRISDQVLPLAEVAQFRLQKNEMLVRVDDAPRETHFRIKAMMLRSDWERDENASEAQATALRRQLDPITRETR